MPKQTALQQKFERRWVCQVVRTGYHNGAGCVPSDPHHHEDWGCSWRWEASLPDNGNVRRLLGVKETKA
jgi:hypothetical protein